MIANSFFQSVFLSSCRLVFCMLVIFSTSIEMQAEDLSRKLFDDELLMENADWQKNIEFGRVLEMYYVDGSNKLVLLENRGTYILDALNGSQIGKYTHQFAKNMGHNLGTDKRRFENSDVGINKEGTLVAYGRSIQEETGFGSELIIHRIADSVDLDTFQFSLDNAQIVGTEFVPGSSLLALSFFGSKGPPERTESIGRYGLFDIEEGRWHYLNADSSSYDFRVSPSGRYVAFNPYYAYDFFAGSFSTWGLDSHGELFDILNNRKVSLPFPRNVVYFSPRENLRLVFTLSDEWFVPADAFLQNDDNPRLLSIQGVNSDGRILDDGEHYAYIAGRLGTAESHIKIVHLKSGGIVVAECHPSNKQLTSFALSPDGSKIAFADVKGNIWQEDFHCEITDIRTVDVKEAANAQTSDNTAGFRLAPNPVTAFLLISHPELTSGRVRILDMTGREILSFKFNNQVESQLDLGTLSPGVYGLEITDGVSSEREVFVKP